MQNDIISPEEVAKRLGISMAYVYRLVNAGKMPSIRLGRRIIIPRAAWEHWFEEQAQDALARCLEEDGK